MPRSWPWAKIWCGVPTALLHSRPRKAKGAIRSSFGAGNVVISGAWDVERVLITNHIHVMRTETFCGWKNAGFVALLWTTVGSAAMLNAQKSRASCVGRSENAVTYAAVSTAKRPACHVWRAIPSSDQSFAPFVGQKTSHRLRPSC